MDMINIIFGKKRLLEERLLPFGFESEDGVYVYRCILTESGFNMTVRIAVTGEISSEVTDPELDEPYTLHLAENAAGSFVGSVRSQYEAVLSEIAEKCFAEDIFKAEQTKAVISYALEKYSDRPEFLWKKLSDNAVLRRKDSQKWYAAILKAAKGKLGLDSDETAEIIDLRIEPEKMESLIDNRLYFPGWHMNKKSWYSIILDGSVPFEEICRRLDESYMLAANRR